MMPNNQALKVVVITGSTRGIGFGLARAFLERGCIVLVSGRSPKAVQLAVAELAGRHGSERVSGLPCDVTDPDQVQALWDFAVTHFGRIDIWINNAGIAHARMDFWQLTPAQMKNVVETNILGTMYGTRVALRGLLAQGHGALYNMEGLGSDGRQVAGTELYGATKAALAYLDRGLAKQTQGTAVIAGSLRPGMVVTDLVLDQFEGRPDDLERAKPILNIISERVETVAPVLVERILSNRKNGACIAFSSPGRLLLKFIGAPFRKRDLFGARPNP